MPQKVPKALDGPSMGMTDRYAMDLYQMMFEPYEKVMFGFRE